MSEITKRKTGLLLLPAVLLAASLVQDAPAALAGPAASSWKQKTDVHNENPACAGLAGRMRKHVISLSQLRAAIAKDAAGPAPSIAGAVKNWLGEPYTSTSLKKKRQKFDAEMQQTKDLDTLSRSFGCDPFDIDEEMRREAAKHPAAGTR